MRTLIIMCLASSLAVVHGFSWNKCESEGSGFELIDFALSPEPLQLPGVSRVTFVANTTATMSGMNIRLKLQRVSRVLWWDVKLPIPCLFNVGSCYYKDTCTLLGRMERENWGGVARQVASQIKSLVAEALPGRSLGCPLPPTAFNIRNRPVQIPRVPAFLSMFASGRYNARVEVEEAASGKVVNCFEVQLRIST